MVLPETSDNDLPVMPPLQTEDKYHMHAAGSDTPPNILTETPVVPPPDDLKPDIFNKSFIESFEGTSDHLRTVCRHCPFVSIIFENRFACYSSGPYSKRTSHIGPNN